MSLIPVFDVTHLDLWGRSVRVKAISVWKLFRFITAACCIWKVHIAYCFALLFSHLLEKILPTLPNIFPGQYMFYVT